MELETYTIGQALASGLYSDVLDYALGRSARFLLVVRDSLGLTSRANELLARLESFLLKDYRSSRWPGTKLAKGTARILEYTFTDESKAILQRTARSLFDWKQPDLPEDLCLLRPSGDVWLATICHEEDAFFEITPRELEAMLQCLPSLGGCLLPPGHGD